ncbi:DUF5610 domain-containing protein [Idiomarina loihiensis]|uniref:DUF5610 domain-containing protein n=1 Tax=Idiomarina loihiensis TaxID=135577 RepID=UPI00129C44C4|nr:DUF5610 domain-containing protein [Idiomarina loihiensis]MRJ45364.1 hypothetical protein [Idiomarina loihiensis]UTW33463.1 DUF5610 domain-containing protein [Idiomarina loihiensis]
MSITTGNSTSVTGSGKQNSPAKTDDNRNSMKEMAAQSKQANNAGILRAHERVSLNSNNDSLSLLYKTALEGINAELEPVMGKNATQKIYDSGVDTSPEATADRIVSFATNFYGRYKEMNPGESEEETLNNFMEAITGGIEKGFDDAKNILTGLQAYEGEVESGVDKTYDLVMKGLDSFREKMLELAAESEESENSAED